MSNSQKQVIRELRQEFPSMEFIGVLRFYHLKEKRLAEKRAALERKKTIERISLREHMSSALATEFYDVCHAGV